MDLDSLICQYIMDKETLDNCKAVVDEENAQIKSIMLESKSKEHIVAGYKATCTVSERVTMNEEMLLEIAHQYGISEIVKTKEYIDFDALEHAIYNGKISNDILFEMDKAKNVKEVVTLKVTKLKMKKKKEEN